MLKVYHKGTVVSGVPLMLSVLRCGNSYKFVGRDQEACWAHHGYCYEFEARSKTFKAKDKVSQLIANRNLGVAQESKPDKVHQGVEDLGSRRGKRIYGTRSPEVWVVQA